MSTKNGFPSSSLNDLYPMYYPFKRFVVTMPIMVSGRIDGNSQTIELAAHDKKEAIKSAKKYFRKQLAAALKEMKVYER
jgi:hypothetical protein